MPQQTPASAEVVEFERFLAPNAEEAAGRTAAVQRVAAVVQSIWPSAIVQVFGSFATGAHVVFCYTSITAVLCGVTLYVQLLQFGRHSGCVLRD